jgi:alkanesulfonate monooxygenase SsuD/methylene tetrahydromethanopterin reductase-like flavin-dependent oxidoreductase (luciferase family)
MILGSPQEAIDKILFEHELFGMTRFLIQFSVGTLPHATVMRSIELYGTVVAPTVRKAVALKKAS